MRLRTTLLCAIICGATFAPRLRAQEQSAPAVMTRQGNGSVGLAGTWRITVTLQDCQTHAPLGNPFYSLLTIVSGGTLGGTTASPAFLPGQRSPDFGTWRRTDWSTYSAINEAFIIFNGGPFTAGVQTLRHKITLSEDGNDFTDEATTQFADFNGNQLTPPPGCASAVAKRVQ